MKNQKKDDAIERIYDDILQLYFSKNYLEIISPAVRKDLTGATWTAKVRNFLLPFAKFLKRDAAYRRAFRAAFSRENLEGKIWLFVASQNNRNSLKFLLEHLEDSRIVGYGIPIEASDAFQIPFYRSVLSAWKFPRIFIFFLKKYGRKAVKYSDLIFKNVGLYEVAYETLAAYRPKCLVLANDHSEKQRALLNAALRLNVPTVYLQHASISDYMPPLDFDLSLLEGQDALDKYRAKGAIRGAVKLVGMPKFDDFVRFRNVSETVQRVGICTNLLDEPAAVAELLAQLTAHFPSLRFSYRPHPNEKRQVDLPQGVDFSGREEGIFEFLKRQDLIVAASSSVHLEAVLLNVTSVYYEVTPLSATLHDVYGYVRSGLATEAQSLAELLALVQQFVTHRPSVVQKASYYNAAIGTAHEDKSGVLAAAAIVSFLVEGRATNVKCVN